MSYEGRIQVICQNGHYGVREASYDLDTEEASCQCGAKLAWFNSVDDTNCEAWGEIPETVLQEKFMVSDEMVQVCNLGHSHIVIPRIYRVPSEEEAKALRTFRPDGGDGSAVLVGDWERF